MNLATRKSRLDRFAIIVLVLCCAFWGFQQILIKIASQDMPPLWQASLRMAGATALLMLWCFWRRVPLFGRDGSLWAGLLTGALFAGEFVFIYLGLVHTNASRLTVFLYTSPFVVAVLLPRVVPAERLGAMQWVGLGVAFVSVALAFAEGFVSAQGPSEHGLGDAMGLLAGVLWGLTTLTIRASRVATCSAEKILFYQLAVTAVVAPCVSLALGERWGWSYSSLTWVSLALQTAVGAFASYLAWMWMLRHYPATQMATFTFLTPVFALLFGVGLLGEPLSWQLVLALMGVACGIVLVNRRG